MRLKAGTERSQAETEGAWRGSKLRMREQGVSKSWMKNLGCSRLYEKELGGFRLGQSDPRRIQAEEEEVRWHQAVIEIMGCPSLRPRKLEGSRLGQRGSVTPGWDERRTVTQG